MMSRINWHEVGAKIYAALLIGSLILGAVTLVSIGRKLGDLIDRPYSAAICMTATTTSSPSPSSVLPGTITYNIYGAPSPPKKKPAAQGFTEKWDRAIMPSDDGTANIESFGGIISDPPLTGRDDMPLGIKGVPPLDPCVARMSCEPMPNTRDMPLDVTGSWVAKKWKCGHPGDGLVVINGVPMCMAGNHMELAR